jgi:hypothetical protein
MWKDYLGSLADRSFRSSAVGSYTEIPQHGTTNKIATMSKGKYFTRDLLYALHGTTPVLLQTQ